MLEDQRKILEQILALTAEHRPDGILIAGDLYDKSMPSAEAVELADWFLSSFAERKVPVWVISGNHDCAQRVAYGSRMLEQSGIYMARVFDGTLQGYTVMKRQDGSVSVGSTCPGNASSGSVCPGSASSDGMCPGSVSPDGICSGSASPGSDPEMADIWLLPYIRPVQVRKYFPRQVIETTQQAVDAVLGSVSLSRDRVNILLMHQFLAGASVCDSEEISVGGSDQVSASSVDAFDYVALGHLHGPQRVGRDTVRYCGSPLKYSFSEAGHRKSVTVIEIGNNTESGRKAEADSAASGRQTASDRIRLSMLPLIPYRDLREIRGPIEQLLSPEVYRETNTEDYLHITLTDENPVLDAIGKLRQVYPNIMRLDFAAASESETVQEEITIEEKTAPELFEEFFFRQNGREMSGEQKRITEEIWETMILKND